MANTDIRTPRSDFKYSTSQFEDIGRSWVAGDAGKRVFKVTESVHKTGLTAADVTGLTKFPTKMILPMNMDGNHWVSFGVVVDRPAAGGPMKVDIKFSDSLGDPSKTYDQISPKVRAEAARISSLFPAGTTVTSGLYKHTWRQGDVVSCGPYCVANAERIVDGKGAEPLKSRIEVREEQLDKMTTPQVVKSASTDKIIDKILAHYVLKKGVGGEIPDDGVDEACAMFHADHSDKYGSVADLRRKFSDEYGASQVAPKARATEIATALGLQESTVSLVEGVRREIEASMGDAPDAEQRSYGAMLEYMSAQRPAASGMTREVDEVVMPLMEYMQPADRFERISNALKEINFRLRHLESSRGEFSEMLEKYDDKAMEFMGFGHAPEPEEDLSAAASASASASAGAKSDDPKKPATELSVDGLVEMLDDRLVRDVGGMARDMGIARDAAFGIAKEGLVEEFRRSGQMPQSVVDLVDEMTPANMEEKKAEVVEAYQDHFGLPKTIHTSYQLEKMLDARLHGDVDSLVAVAGGDIALDVAFGMAKESLVEELQRDDRGLSAPVISAISAIDPAQFSEGKASITRQFEADVEAKRIFKAAARSADSGAKSAGASPHARGARAKGGRGF